MNKHVVAFLSVFTLGLVLSVYYVFIPKGGPSNSEVNGSVSSVDYKKVYFQGLEKEREASHKKKIDGYNAKLINCSQEEKAQYISLIEQENSIFSDEKRIDKMIKDLDYPYSVTKIFENNVLVIYASRLKGDDEVELSYLALSESGKANVSLIKK